MIGSLPTYPVKLTWQAPRLPPIARVYHAAYHQRDHDDRQHPYP